VEEEIEQILRFVYQPTGSQILRVFKRTRYDLMFDILPEPRGVFMLSTTLNYPQRQPFWTILIDDKKMESLEFPVKASTLLQAFICCMFIIAKRLDIEMPVNVIQFDPQFHAYLCSEYPEDCVIFLFK
ncbi:unnamed protein product, partial [Hymenolepis diminuta]